MEQAAPSRPSQSKMDIDTLEKGFWDVRKVLLKMAEEVKEKKNRLWQTVSREATYRPSVSEWTRVLVEVRSRSTLSQPCWSGLELQLAYCDKNEQGLIGRCEANTGHFVGPSVA